MDENKELETGTPEELNAKVLNKEAYVPRPKWQIIAAWAGIGIVVVGFALYCCHIAGIL